MPNATQPLIVEFHLLQNFSPSCLNRDDTNTPKSCIFGGVRRARVSSQCLKRAMRIHMRDHYGIPTGVRTRRLAEVIAKRLEQRGRDWNEALALARFALEKSGFELSRGSEEEVRTQVGLYLAKDEIERLVNAVEEDWGLLADARATAEQDAAQSAESREGSRSGRGRRRNNRSETDRVQLPNVQEAIQAIRDTVDAADIALFGRMVAENTHMKVDAASQVAHAFSTHACELEMDYFTAVDDEQPDEDPGAGMLGLVGFQSACFYRYSLVHRDQLVANLRGNAQQANETILAFLRAAVEAIPTGRQNGSAAHNWPDYIAVRAGARLPLNLANAFVRPVPRHSDESLVEASARALERYRDTLTRVYGADGKWFVCSTVTDGNGSLEELEKWLRSRLPEA